MVQKRILRKEQDETTYNNVVQVLRLHRNSDVKRISPFNVRRKLVEIYRMNNKTPRNNRISYDTIEGFNQNTTETQTHALHLIGYRSLNQQGELKFNPLYDPVLMDSVKVGEIITTLEQLQNAGFSTIYSGWNSRDEFKVGACKDYKAPRYADKLMKIKYAISLVTDLGSFSLVIRNDVKDYVSAVKIQTKRRDYSREIERADRKYARKLEDNAKIIDIAMQGFKKRDKIRALHNLCINQMINDCEIYNAYETKARNWVSENAWTDIDEVNTKTTIENYKQIIGELVKNIDCDYSIAKKIYDNENLQNL